MMSQRTVILHQDVCVPLPETTTLLLRFCLLPNLWKATASVSGQGAKTKCFCLLVFEKEGEETEDEVVVKGVINMPFYKYLWSFWLMINVRPLYWSLSLKKRPGNGHNRGPLSLSFSHSIRVHVAKITPGNFTKDYIFCTSSQATPADQHFLVKPRHQSDKSIFTRPAFYGLHKICIRLCEGSTRVILG